MITKRVHEYEITFKHLKNNKGEPVDNGAIEFIFKNHDDIDIILNSFKLFGLKRKLDVFCPIEAFFELHSRATEGKKGKKWAEKSNFLAN